MTQLDNALISHNEITRSRNQDVNKAKKLELVKQRKRLTDPIYDDIIEQHFQIIKTKFEKHYDYICKQISKGLHPFGNFSDFYFLHSKKLDKKYHKYIYDSSWRSMFCWTCLPGNECLANTSLNKRRVVRGICKKFHEYQPKLKLVYQSRDYDEIYALNIEVSELGEPSRDNA
jgi:hypothetical protein